jgi:hypothetical protein
MTAVSKEQKPYVHIIISAPVTTASLSKEMRSSPCAVWIMTLSLANLSVLLLAGHQVSVTDTESYRDLQESYGAYNFVTELEIRTVRVLSRPYNQGTYVRCAGMARRPLTVTGTVQQQFSTDLNSALFACRPTSWAGSAE